MAEEPKRKRDGIVDPVCQDILAVFDRRVYEQNNQKDQQARGLLQAVCQKLDPQKLFLNGNSEKPTKDFLVECQRTIARLQDYSAMVARRLDSKNDITLISEKEITLFYNQKEPSFEKKHKPGDKRKSAVGSDSDEDEIEKTPAKKAARRDKDNDVLKNDISELETKVNSEKETYDESLDQLNGAKSALDAAKIKAKEELGDQPDMADDIDGAMRYVTDFKAKIKQAQDYYNGKGRGTKQSCLAYNKACRSKLAEAITKLETKYEQAKSVDELAEYDYKDLTALRNECEITSEWLSYAIKPSKIHGYGLFSTRLIKKGEVIGKYDGPVVARAESEAAMQELTRPMKNDKLLAVRNYSGDKTGYLALDGRQCDMSYINDYYPDQSRQNAYFSPGGFVRALRDIKKGEELLVDYGSRFRDKYIIKHSYLELTSANESLAIKILEMLPILVSQLNCEQDHVATLNNRESMDTLKGTSYSFGYNVYHQESFLTRHEPRAPEIIRLAHLLLGFISPTDMDYGSFTINKNRKFKKHFDKKNVKPSIIVSFGDYAAGGGLIIYNASQRKALDIRNRFLLFDGRDLEHETEEWSGGDRWTLVFFKLTNSREKALGQLAAHN